MDQLNRTSDEVGRTLDAANTRLVSALNFKTDELTDKIVDISGELSQTLSARLDRIADGLRRRRPGSPTRWSSAPRTPGGTQHADQRSSPKTSRKRSEDVVTKLVETGSRMAETLVTRGDEVNSSIRSSGNSLALDLSLRGGDLVNKLEEAGTRITDTIVTRSNTATATFERKADEVSALIGSRTEAVQKTLASRLADLETVLTRDGSALAERMSNDAGEPGRDRARSMSSTAPSTVSGGNWSIRSISAAAQYNDRGSRQCRNLRGAHGRASRGSRSQAARWPRRLRCPHQRLAESRRDDRNLDAFSDGRRPRSQVSGRTSAT